MEEELREATSSLAQLFKVWRAVFRIWIWSGFNWFVGPEFGIRILAKINLNENLKITGNGIRHRKYQMLQFYLPVLYAFASAHWKPNRLSLIYNISYSKLFQTFDVDLR